ncbi:MAG: hypothetical protein KME31_15130 [Tolypothrix carrinoi HA7290-LM1]|jgi:hypothetical protein|nr:hypothetical protein [Tolypothrix carrinoi HA7290-LM1]
MSRITILDLSFCESEISGSSQIQGGIGITVYSPTGTWSVSADSAHSHSHYTNHFFDKETGSYGYVVAAQFSGAVAGAAAGAASDGTQYASSYSGTTAY